MPIEKICGIGPRMTMYLQQMSVFTCGQLWDISETILVERFGKYGCWLKQTARGEGSSLVKFTAEQRSAPKSVGHSYTLEKDIANPELIYGWVRLLCEMVAARLRGCSSSTGAG